MRNQPNTRIENFRIPGTMGGPPHTNTGFFVFPHRGHELRVQASQGCGWDHVSVSLANRCPTWEEMCFVKEKFFRDDEAVMQLHPARSEYVNIHPNCLHLWRPQTAEEMEAEKRTWVAAGEEWPYEVAPPGNIPLPPSILVGPKSDKASV